ncbi:MAG TPA: hypothetical protein EYP88_04275 [Anaerolineales bacterium]|nr:hypothetical protein [Anaerolineales bacterium]
MARKHRLQRLEKIYQAVVDHPGEHPGRLAQLLGEPRSQITRTLPALEEHGYLLSEDEKGRLWPFEKKSR